MLLEHVSCDLCGCSNYKVRYRKPDTWLLNTAFQFPVVECTNCRLVYVNPRPTTDSMSEFYPSDYHSDRDSVEHLQRYSVQRQLLPELTGKAVLDIGCARGDFLTYLMDSEPTLKAWGVDAFSPGVDDSRIAFTKGALTTAGYTAAQFDLVMSWAVFEHLHQPKAYFVESARVLKPGGKLVILVTNAESAFGRMAQAEDVPRHTYHYSRRTLARYGAECGLDLQSVAYRDDIFDGRGIGSARLLIGKIAGFTWEKHVLGTIRAYQRAAMRFGSLVDKAVFAGHWEARLGLSGIMVATYEKV